MRQQLSERVVARAAVHHVREVVSALHDLLPRLVDVREPLRLLRQLLGDVAAAKHRLQVDPEVLHQKPAARGQSVSLGLGLGLGGSVSFNVTASQRRYVYPEV